MKRLINGLPGIAIALCLFATTPAWAETEASATPQPPGPRPVLSSGSTADHSKFEELQQEFISGPEVTKACLGCHTEADEQVMSSIHYTWEYESTAGQILGKSVVINSFCGSVVGNEARCTSCHAGYGWKDMSTAPSSAGEAVDCLICHDRSGQYAKAAAGAGHPALDPVKPGTITATGRPAWPVDLAKSAQSVGMPGRENCGECHFYGGGGDNVKHGDLSSALYAPSREVDVHMAVGEGELNFTCSACHVSDMHNWSGSRYDVMASDPDGVGGPGHRRDVATCESCHDTAPHAATIIGLKLNDHVDAVACQTCHIPEFAKGGVATKTLWDWSTAGQLTDEKKPLIEHGYTQGDGRELHSYHGFKGGFEWDEDVEPYYAFFDGQLRYTLADMEIDPSAPVDVNRITGEYGDGVSRIWPFKRMEGRQPYDAGRNTLAYSHVFGPGSDTAFWGNFDWDKALDAGMKAAGLEYSGEYDFVETYMYWPITHMVAPADEALGCAACHAEDGRLANLAGFHLPGANPTSTTGLIGLALVVLTVLGIAGHGLLRLFTRKGEAND